MTITAIERGVVIPPPRATRARTAVRRGPDFGALVRGSLGVVLGSASVAGGPLVASAVRAATVPAAHGPSSGMASAARRAAGLPGSLGTADSGDGFMDEMKALQQQSRDLNLEMLALQVQVQQENRRFTTASNVLKARHDTAKAAITNIRS